MSNTAAEISKLVRSRRGWTQQQLAERLLLSRNYIAQIESGLKEGSTRVLRDLQALMMESDATSTPSTISPNTDVGAVHESQAPWGGVSWRTAAEKVLEKTLDEAAANQDRLQWIVGELKLLRIRAAQWGENGLRSKMSPEVEHELKVIRREAEIAAAGFREAAENLSPLPEKRPPAAAPGQ